MIKLKTIGELTNNAIAELFDLKFDISMNFKYYFPKNNLIKVLESHKSKLEKKSKPVKCKSPKHHIKIFNTESKYQLVSCNSGSG